MFAGISNYYKNIYKMTLEYSKAQKYVKDKDIALNFLLHNILSKTLKMFDWQGLPQTIPAQELEKILQVKGFCYITKFKDDLFAFDCNESGNLDVYGNYKDVIISNANINYFATLQKDADGVFCQNDILKLGLIPTIAKYGCLIVDNEISLNTLITFARCTMVLSATDDNTADSAKDFVNNILDGKFSIILDNAFLQGLKINNLQNNNSQILNLIETLNYYKAKLLNEIGLQSNWNAKRERLNETEILLNADELQPFVENMLFCRKEFARKLNETYDLNISVELANVWKSQHETTDKYNDATETETETESTEPAEPATETETETATETEPETTETTETEKNDL